jgi:hypothetical protein
MASLDDIAALLRQQNELLQKFLLVSGMPATPSEPVKSKARRDEEARQRFQRKRLNKEATNA